MLRAHNIFSIVAALNSCVPLVDPLMTMRRAMLVGLQSWVLLFPFGDQVVRWDVCLSMPLRPLHTVLIIISGFLLRQNPSPLAALYGSC